MVLKRDKKNKLQIEAKNFHTEVLLGSSLLHECLNDLIQGKLDKSKLEKVIQSEHEADRAKERYIEVLYKNKRALPFLVEDRYRLIKYLDGVSDYSEELARDLKVYPFQLFDDIKDEMHRLNDLYENTVKALVEMIDFMETDFKRAYQISFNIETLKREARIAKYDIIGIIYQKPQEKSLRVYLTSKICIKMFDMIEKAEEISDFLRSLIIKYPSK